MYTPAYASKLGPLIPIDSLLTPGPRNIHLGYAGCPLDSPGEGLGPFGQGMVQKAGRGTQVLTATTWLHGRAGGPEQGLLKHSAEALPAQSKGNPANIQWGTDHKQDKSVKYMKQ